VQKLDFIARIMGTARPRSLPWDPEFEEPPYGWVLKREFGDAARHVYILHYPFGNGKRAFGREMKRVRNFMAGVRARDDPENIKPLAQEYVPAIARVGEIRFMCVDDEPVRTVITGKRRADERNPVVTWGIATMLSLNRIM
jgi:hypothetical protein